jgi:hypothetical protein
MGMFPEKPAAPNDAFAQAELALQRREVHDALDLYSIAEQQGFDGDACCGARWVCHMLLGDFESAWRESDRIAKHGRPDVNRFWDGKPLRGQRVMVRCLHGLGDTIQYARYAPLLRKQAASVTIETQPALKRLIQEAGLADCVMTWGEKEPSWDRQIEVIELPRIFRTTVDTIPAGVPYLKAESRPGLRANGRKFRVGLVWASSLYNPSRCVPLAQLAPLFDGSEAEFFSFQAGENREELDRSKLPIVDAFERTGCVQAAANGLSGMNLVITADTMTAHLAGALGLPVWVLLPFQADWRWMLDRDDSPWYPTMRLFRQQSEGDWSVPIARLREALQRSVSEFSSALSRAAGAA